MGNTEASNLQSPTCIAWLPRGESPPDEPCLNRNADADKKHLADHFFRVFRYPLGVDPRHHAGEIVQKSLRNGAHDGQIVRCPIREPILVDPARSRNWSDYGQVTLIKANLAEATEAWVAGECTPMSLANKLSQKHACHVVMTIGERGLVCAERGKESWHLPAISVEVRDVCGTGDTVFAALGVSLACGHSLPQSCQFATAAASQQVATIGITQPHCEFTKSGPPSSVRTWPRAVA